MMWVLAATIMFAAGGSDERRSALGVLPGDANGSGNGFGHHRSRVGNLGLDVPLLHALGAREAEAISSRPLEMGDAPGQDTPRRERQGPALAGGVDSIRALIRAVFGEHGEEALNVMWCESGGDPGVVSYDGSSYGLFQLHAPTWARVFPDFWEWWSDPQWNIEHARIIFERAGSFSPWSCSGRIR